MLLGHLSLVVLVCDTSRSVPQLRFLLAGFSSPRHRVRSHGSPYGICGGQTATGAGSSVFPCQYYSTAAPYSLLCQLGGTHRGPDSDNISTETWSHVAEITIIATTTTDLTNEICFL